MAGERMGIRFLPVWFFLARVVLFLSLSFEGLRGYTDYWNYYSLAGQGLPYFDYWVEFPPVFPFLLSIVYRLAGGSEHAFVYVMALLLSAAQAGGLGLFIAIGREYWGEERVSQRAGWYAALLVGLFYGWGFFDAMVVTALLAGLLWLVKSQGPNLGQVPESSLMEQGGLLDNKDILDSYTIWSGMVLGLGGLLKWFPLLVMGAVWRFLPLQRAVKVTGLALGMVALTYGVLFFASPELTLASVRSQGVKGSWETIWALIDGNVRTGNFGVDLDRTNPDTALLSTGNPARISSLITLIPFAGIGLWLFTRTRLTTPRGLVAFTGLTLSIFMLWSPGWSPQWSLYFLPLILLVLPGRVAGLMSVVWVGINLLEWPLLLSRGWFTGLWLVIPVRTLLLVLLAVEFWRSCEKSA